MNSVQMHGRSRRTSSNQGVYEQLLKLRETANIIPLPGNELSPLSIFTSNNTKPKYKQQKAMIIREIKKAKEQQKLHSKVQYFKVLLF